jgi:hypothetical protein
VERRLMVERFHVGQRVRLKDTLETKPPGLFPRGAMGTVTNVGLLLAPDAVLTIQV